MFQLYKTQDILFLAFDDQLKHSIASDYDLTSALKRVSQQTFIKAVFLFSNTTYIDTAHISFIKNFSSLLISHGFNVEVWSCPKEIELLISQFWDDSKLCFNHDTSDFINNINGIYGLLPTHNSIKSSSKRCLDVIGSIVGILIFLSTFPVVALLIKATSKGPVFFLQKRIGLHGKPFLIIKYRTMYLNAEENQQKIQNQISGPFFKSHDDPRITSLGKFLRKFSIDEIPQFINVLLGQMSLVGTRPPTLNEVRKYKYSYWQRLDVKPGMTGQWQVSGRSNISHFTEVLDLDLDYQKYWSNSNDIRLLIRTLALLIGKNSGSA